MQSRQSDKEYSTESRRRLLKALGIAGGGTVVARTVLPAAWLKPVVDAVVLPLHAQASPVLPTTITFSYSGAGELSGTLDGTPFATTGFVITATGQISNRTQPFFGWALNNTTASIEIVGVGTYNFVTPTGLWVSNSGASIGFGRADLGGDLYRRPFDNAFLTWDMLSSIGPIAGATEMLQWDALYTDIVTSGGVLRFDGASAYPTVLTLTGSFQATVT
jgi:hypothetical protein